MKKDIVSITDHITNSDIELGILGSSLQPLSLETTILLVWHENINEDYLKKYKNVRAIVRYGVGFDNIDLEYCKKSNISVSNTPDYGVDEVSDTALAMILMLLRRVNSFQEFAKNNENSWLGAEIPFEIRRIKNLKLGIIGLGRIGGSIARKFKPFSNNICFFDPFLPSGIEKTFDIQRYHDLIDLLQSSDIISINTPLNSITRNMVDNQFISNMKKGAILINVSRGPIINNKDIIYNAILSGKLNGYATDVWVDEPPKKKDKLYQSWISNSKINDKIIINPHTAYYSKESLIESREKASLNCLRIINEEDIYNRLV